MYINICIYIYICIFMAHPTPHPTVGAYPLIVDARTRIKLCKQGDPPALSRPSTPQGKRTPSRSTLFDCTSGEPYTISASIHGVALSSPRNDIRNRTR